MYRFARVPLAVLALLVSIAPGAARADRARLEAAGLNPASPTFAGDLKARLAQTRLRLTAHTTTNFVRMLPVRSDKTSPANVLHYTARTNSSISSLAGRTTPLAASGSNSSSFSKYAKELPAADVAGVLGANGFEFVQLDEFLSGAPINLSLPIPVPGDYVMVVSSSKPHLAEPGYATYTMSVPACNASITSSLARLWDPTIQPYDDNYYGWQLPSKPAGRYLYDLSLNAMSYPNGKPLAIGVKPQQMTVTYPSDGSTLTKTFAVINAEKDAETIAASVDDSGNVLPDLRLGFQAANSVVAQPGVSRVNQGSTPLTGTDVLGRGISLGAGYTATAQIISSASIADAPNNSDPNDAYRGAAIVTQPQSGRLETVVNWHVSPFDSLSYRIAWTLTGPPGQRALLTMPLGGPCDS